jgi:hypothetical protein
MKDQRAEEICQHGERVRVNIQRRSVFDEVSELPLRGWTIAIVAACHSSDRLAIR